MQTSLAWLNDYLDQPATADEAAALLTGVGFPVEDRVAVTTAGGLADTMLDVEVTSNRPDCLCHLGLAREVAAASGRALIVPDCASPATSPGESSPADVDKDHADVTTLTRVDNEAGDLCPVYTARVIRGVTVQPSPAWLADRLEAIGLRPINNVVDVTNYVLFELGQPLHAFDLGALHEQRIVVRRAREGEPFQTLDGSEHKLTEAMLVIADAHRPVALAGIMGGANTEVGEATRDVLLESARFDPLSVRRTSRARKLASDSSFRFERAVDPRGVEQAGLRAAGLMQQIAGGQIAPGVIREGEDEPVPHPVTLRPQRCRDLMGLELSDERQGDYLQRLALSPDTSGQTITCTVPTFRRDVQREVDLIEEIARLHGLDQVPVQQKIHIVARPPQPPVQARQLLGRTLAGHGYHETITFSFLEPTQGEPFLPEGFEPATVEQERLRAQSMLRPAVLPSLLICRKANQDLGNRAVKLYECAAAWAQRGGKIEEREHLAMLADVSPPHDAKQQQQAVREMRGTIEETIEMLGGGVQRRRCTVEPVEDARFHSGGEITLDDRPIGRFGLLAKNLQDQFDLQTPAVVAELDLPALIQRYPPPREVADLPRRPAIERDLSIIIDENTPWRRIARSIDDADPALLETITFLDTYRGKPIAQGQKSVSFRMQFRDPRRTLRHEEVDPQVNTVIDALKQNVNAELRG